ncbi:MAG: adenylate/guanylate cyclase domain-containing protein [Phycisphaerae bacterium]|nr:adenylate/guanylate cyclase domain-containing protein [Phycisphaerae bacterium]
MNTEQTHASDAHLIVKLGGHTPFVFDLPEGRDLVLGASPDADCTVTGEKYLSRRHVMLRRAGGVVSVERLATASNPVVFKGVPADRFRMTAGEYFVVGATTFHLEASLEATARPADEQERQPHQQFTLGAHELRVSHDPTDRLRLLDLMKLPEVLRTHSRTEFFIYACGALRLATGARWVQVLRSEGDEVTVLCEDVGVDQLIARPHSRALVRAALTEAPNPVTYCWRHAAGGDLAATAHEGIDWAVCCAMSVPGEPPTAMYLAGAGPAGMDAVAMPAGLRDTARLVGLVADTIGRAIAMRKLEDWQSKLGHFFSGKLVSKILEAEDAEPLMPRIRPATIMFFDIRGFSLMTEGRLERILDHQDDLRRVLTAMTGCIFEYDGVVIRYMGDGILACWNVPYDLANHAERACLASLDMIEQLGRVAPGWTCGIALGVGDVVAGSLGSEQVYSYDVLGPVVNQTARVEGITKAVGEPILVTEEVARAVSPERVLCRRVARFLPVGMDTELDLFTIERTPADTAAKESVLQRHALHAEALAAFEQGDWQRAFDLLHPIVKEDAAARYVYTLALRRDPPRDWHGVVEMTTK